MDCGYLFRDFVQVIYDGFLQGILMGFELTVMDRLPDGLTDESDEVWMEGRNSHPKLWQKSLTM